MSNSRQIKRECPSCALMVDADAKVCPVCDHKFNPYSKWVQWLAMFLIILFLWMMIF
jgi:RNA polymerase subunit RPABC4/transcription elongation factor Spt4